MSTENGHGHVHNGPNYCPSCGLNLKAVFLAMVFAAGVNKPVQPVSPQRLAQPVEPKKKRARRIITPEERAKVQELAKTLSIAQIADQTGIKKGTVVSILHRNKMSHKRS